MKEKKKGRRGEGELAERIVKREWEWGGKCENAIAGLNEKELTQLPVSRCSASEYWARCSLFFALDFGRGWGFSNFSYNLERKKY